jgi:hypothetical protein
MGSTYLPSCAALFHYKTVPSMAVGVLIIQGVSYVKGIHYIYKFIAAETDSTQIR